MISLGQHSQILTHNIEDHYTPYQLSGGGREDSWGGQEGILLKAREEKKRRKEESCCVWDSNGVFAEHKWYHLKQEVSLDFLFLKTAPGITFELVKAPLRKPKNMVLTTCQTKIFSSQLYQWLFHTITFRCVAYLYITLPSLTQRLTSLTD